MYNNDFENSSAENNENTTEINNQNSQNLNSDFSLSESSPSSDVILSQGDFEETSKVTDNEPAPAIGVYSEATQFSKENTDAPQSTPFTDGTRYTNPQSNTIGYEWHPENSARAKKAKKVKKSAAVSGLRIFTTSLLAVFVVSFAALTIMVASYIYSPDRNPPAANSNVNSYTSQTPSTNASSYAAVELPSQTGAHLTVPQIAQKCSPSAVGIVVEIETNSSYNFGFGFSIPSSGVSTAIGSGFILNSDGYIITNHHVIESADKITVMLNDKTELEATLVGSDSLSDIAVLKVEPKDDIPLIPMEMGNSDELVVGEAVVAIGCPAGIEYMGTVTDGIVSAINRDIKITDSYGRVQKTMTLIQTNATINKGNSGGPLINSRGQVIGINTLKLTSQYEGIGFSIPINGAMAIINQLIEHGEVIERTEEDFASGSGVIGISGSAVSAAEAEQYGIPEGVLVFQIDKNSSAAKAGLRRGDIITAYNGKEVKTVQDINDLKSQNRAGETVTVTIYRDVEDEDGKTIGETFDISFKLDAQS